MEEERCTLVIKLYEKMEKEYSDFIEELKGKSPEEIINKSYEKTYKEEILSNFYYASEFDESDLKKLYKCDSPLQELYDGWLDTDASVTEMLRDSIQDTTNELKDLPIKKKDYER